MVETDAYGQMTAAIRDVAADLGAPVHVCLEGGYSPAALAASVAATVAALEGDGDPRGASPAAAEPHLSRLRERWSL
jgi:acetoin utilization deacetylase AcuC-like enzyme